MEAQQAGARYLLLCKVREHYEFAATFHLSLFSPLALPLPEVTIIPDVSTTAGDVYTLTCSATVVDNLAVESNILWLYTNGTTVGGTNITVGVVMMTGVCLLRTSHSAHCAHPMEDGTSAEQVLIYQPYSSKALADSPP